MQRWLSTFLICACLVGCKIKKHEPEPDQTANKDAVAMSTKTPSAEVVALRDEVIAKVSIWGRPDYTPKDWTLFDPSIERALSVNGSDPKKRATVIESAADSVFTKLTKDPAGLEALEKTLAERYNHPVITRDGDLVRIDLGVIAGKPRYYSRPGLVVESPLVDGPGDGVLASEVIRNLKVGIAAQPNAKVYQVEVDIPFRWPNAVPIDWAKGGFTYVYDVASDQIRVYQNDSTDYVYTTEPLGGNLDKVTTLHWSKLQKKPMDRQPVRSFNLRGRSR